MDRTGESDAPSLDQAATAAANRHSTRASSALGFMAAGVDVPGGGRGDAGRDLVAAGDRKRFTCAAAVCAR